MALDGIRSRSNRRGYVGFSRFLSDMVGLHNGYTTAPWGFVGYTYLGVSMTTTTQTLTDFLLARIAEDETDARTAAGHTDGHWASWTHRGHVDGLRDLACGGERLAEPPTDIDEHIARHDPARVLAECAARRRIVELHALVPHPLNRKANPFTGALEEPSFVCEECSGDDDPYVDQVNYPCETIKILASIYADHEDFRDEWRA